MSLYLLSDTTLSVDIPGPNKLEFSSVTARSRLKRAAKDPIPIAMGVAFAGIPYVIGAAIVYFGPAPMKPVGMSMLVPGPSDPILFAMGYKVGERISDPIESTARRAIREAITLPQIHGFDFDYRHLYM